MSRRQAIHLFRMTCLAIAGFTASLLLGTFFVHPTHATQTSLAGIVYTESNIPTENGNTILGFRRDPEGNLSPLPGSPFPTGGAGFVDPKFTLGGFASDQNIVVNPENTRLFAVNSGSNTISVFDIDPDGSLSPVNGSPFPSGGVDPVSLGLAGDFLYVVHKNRDPQDSSRESSESLPNYTGFRVKPNGDLIPIPGSTIEVPAGSGPTQALISVDKKFLFGAEETGGMLRSFKILSDGRLEESPNSPQPLPASEFEGLTLPSYLKAEIGETTTVPRLPLGLQVHPHLPILYVGFFTASKLGVYSYDEQTGELTFLRTVPYAGEAVGWFFANKAGTRLYTSNTHDNSISVYDLKDPTTPEEIQKVTLKGVGGPFQIALDEPAESFLHVVTQQDTRNSPENEANALHILKVNPEDGTLIEVDSSPLVIPPVAGSRPQGIIAESGVGVRMRRRPIFHGHGDQPPTHVHITLRGG